jgi:ankyrin repeat protein
MLRVVAEERGADFAAHLSRHELYSHVLQGLVDKIVLPTVTSDVLRGAARELGSDGIHVGLRNLARLAHEKRQVEFGPEQLTAAFPDVRSAAALWLLARAGQLSPLEPRGDDKLAFFHATVQERLTAESGIPPSYFTDSARLEDAWWQPVLLTALRTMSFDQRKSMLASMAELHVPLAMGMRVTVFDQEEIISDSVFIGEGVLFEGIVLRVGKEHVIVHLSLRTDVRLLIFLLLVLLLLPVIDPPSPSKQTAFYNTLWFICYPPCFLMFLLFTAYYVTLHLHLTKFLRGNVLRKRGGITALLRAAAAFGDLDVLKELMNLRVGTSSLSPGLIHHQQTDRDAFTDAIGTAEPGSCDTALHVATRSGQLECVRHLFEQGCSHLVVNVQYQRPVDFASNVKLPATIRRKLGQILMPSLCDVDAKLLYSSSALCVAAVSGDTAEISRLLDLAEPNHMDDAIIAPLILAAYYGANNVVQLLLQKAVCCVNNVSQNGCTPLHFASWNGHVDVISALLEAGAEVDRSDSQGCTPLFRAADSGDLRSVLLLQTSGADNDHTDNEGFTPLHVATQKGHADVITALLEAGANPACTATKDGITPLFIAASNGHTDAIKKLLGHLSTIQVNQPLKPATNLGSWRRSAESGVEDPRPAVSLSYLQKDATPLHAAAIGGHADAIKGLIVAGAQLEEKDMSGMTPLHYASVHTHTSAVAVLLAAGANPNAIDKDDKMPLYYAEKSNLGDEIATLLVNAGAARLVKFLCWCERAHKMPKFSFASVLTRVCLFRKLALSQFIKWQSFGISIIYAWLCVRWSSNASNNDGVDYDVLVVANVTTPCYMCPDCLNPNKYCLTEDQKSLRMRTQWTFFVLYSVSAFVKVYCSMADWKTIAKRRIIKYCVNPGMIFMQFLMWIAWVVTTQAVYGEVWWMGYEFLVPIPFECYFTHSFNTMHRYMLQLRPGTHEQFHAADDTV